MTTAESTPRPLLRLAAALVALAMAWLAHPASAAVPGDVDGDDRASARDAVRYVLHLQGLRAADDAPAIPPAFTSLADHDQSSLLEAADLAIERDLILARDAALAPTILVTSPLDGEGDVAVTRETILRFGRPLSESAVVSSATIGAEIAGQPLAATLHVAPDRSQVTLFYASTLPHSSRIRVNVDGSALFDAFGRAVDADADGTPGGVEDVDFDTLSLSAISDTYVCGMVYASELGADGAGSVNVPLPGVTITVDGAESTYVAVTGPMGEFRLPCPAGSFFVHVDGRTSTYVPQPGAYYPFVGKQWHAIAGEEVNVEQVYLPLVLPGTLQPVSVTEATTVHMADGVLDAFPEFASVSVRVPANSLFADDGTRGGEVGIAPVPPDRLPGKLPPGLNFPVVITVQTSAAAGSGGAMPTNFDTPVEACFPNLPFPPDDAVLEPGSKSALWSFNHDTGRFEVVGPMTVTDDGTLVCSDPGYGVLAPGWHGSQPGSQVDGPRPQPPPPCRFEWTDAWDYAKVAYDCFKKVSKILEAIEALIETVNNIKTIALSLKQLKDEYQNGLTAANVKAALEAINATKGIAKLAWEQAKEAAPTDFILNAVQCGSNTVSWLVNLICKPDCLRNSWIREICEWAQPIVSTINVFIQKVDDLNKSLTEAPFEVVCGSLDALIALVNRPPAQGISQANGEAPDPEWLAAFDQAIADADSFEPAAQPGVDAGPVVDAFGTAVGATRAPAMGLVGSIAGLQDAWYLFESGDVVLRGQANAFGQIQLLVRPARPYTIRFLALAQDAIVQGSGSTPPNGARGELAALEYVTLEGEPDTDGDGIADVAEVIPGTDPADADSDDDGLLDGAEILAGTNPLDNRPTRVGILAVADTPGEAQDVAAQDEVVAIADGAAGVSVFNVFNAMDPTLVARVDTPGTAHRVALSGLLLAVADGPSGLAVVDITDPPAARIVRQIVLGNVSCVTASAGIAYVGLAGSQLAAVDLETGEVLSRVTMPEGIVDVALGGDVLYALGSEQLHAVSIEGGVLSRLSSVPSPHAGPANMRLFVGGGLARAVHGKGYNTFTLAVPGAPVLMEAGDTTALGWRDVALNGSGLAVAIVGGSSIDDTPHDVSLYDATRPLSDPDAFRATIPLPGQGRALTLYNGIAYVATGAAGLSVVNYLAFDALGQPPSVAVDGPFTAGSVEEGRPILVTASVGDDVQVRNVEFYVDGVRVATDGNFPFEHRFVTPALSQQASFRLSARASDTGGNAAFSLERVVTLRPDTTPPRVAGTFPGSGSFGVAPAAVRARFNEAMNPLSFVAGSMTVVSPGDDAAFDTADDVVRQGSVSYDATSRTATLQLPSALPSGRHRGVVAGTVTDVAGNVLGLAHAWPFSGIAGTDADGDGLSDAWESANGFNPSVADQNANGAPDGDDDQDGDGLSNGFEMLLGTNPRNRDSDGDGTWDGSEDADADDLANAAEPSYDADPLTADSDLDGWLDGVEVAAGSNPANRSSIPRPFVLTGPSVVALVTDPAAPANTTGAATLVSATPAVTVLTDQVLDENGLSAGRDLVTAVPRAGALIILLDPDDETKAAEGAVTQPAVTVRIPNP